MSCEKCEMTLISLNNDVLLHIFKFLNWIDSIHLAATCKGMQNLNYYEYKRNQKFDFNKCVWKAVENILPVIGPYIRAANITEHQVMSKSFLKNCCNIKSLKIDGYISQSATITLNTWMKELKIDSLFIGLSLEHMERLLDGIEGLESFVFDSFETLLPSNFFHKNSTIQHLALTIGDYYDSSLELSSLLVLHSLQSLVLTITTKGTDILDDVRRSLEINHLKEFSINIKVFNWNADIANFAKYLAENTNLDKLRIGGWIDIDDTTFSTLNFFNLTSLSLDVGFYWEDISTALHESASRLKYLGLKWLISWCSFAKIGHILKMWTTVEAICFNVDIEADDLVIQFKDDFFFKILEISDNRPGLKLHIFSSEICFNFISKRYDVIKGRECSFKDNFQLWDRVDCS